MSGRFCLVSDDDGHHWLCPVDREREALAQIERCRQYYNVGDYEAEPPTPPERLEYLRRVDNPSCLTFTDPREEL